MQLPSALRISLALSLPFSLFCLSPSPLSLSIPLSLSRSLSFSLCVYKRYLDTRTIPTVKIPSRSRHCYSSEQIPVPQQLNSKTVAR